MEQTTNVYTPDTLQSLVLGGIALNKVNKPESLYAAVQQLTTQYPHIEESGIISNMCVAIAKKSDEETQQQLFDFLYEKMFDVPLFKKHTIRDYTQDLQEWSNTNPAYKIYAALSRARGEKSCCGLLEEHADLLHRHYCQLRDVHDPNFTLGDVILENVHSWHDMHTLLDNIQYFKDIFFDDCHNKWAKDRYMHLCCDNQPKRLYLPLIATCVATCISKKRMQPLRYLYVGYKRNIYNSDFYALHSPIFNDTRRWGSLLVNGLYMGQRKFEIMLSLDYQIKLPVDIISRLPLHLTLDIQNPIVSLDYQGNNYNITYGKIGYDLKKKEYYIFKPWWRVKTLVSVGIVGALAYWTWKYINQKHTEGITTINQSFQRSSKQIFTTTINNHEQKLALRYVAENTPTIEGSTTKLVQEYTKDIVINPKTVLSIENIEHAQHVVNTLNNNIKDHLLKSAVVNVKTFFCKAAFIGSIAISSGIRLLLDSLSFVAPSIFGSPQCTVKCCIWEKGLK
jgi:hypothetical protein